MFFEGWVYGLFCHLTRGYVQRVRVRPDIFLYGLTVGTAPSHLSQGWRISLIIRREGDGVVGPHWLVLVLFFFFFLTNTYKSQSLFYFAAPHGDWLRFATDLLFLSPWFPISIFFILVDRDLFLFESSLYFVVSLYALFQTRNRAKLWSIARVHPLDIDRYNNSRTAMNLIENFLFLFFPFRSIHTHTTEEFEETCYHGE